MTTEPRSARPAAFGRRAFVILLTCVLAMLSACVVASYGSPSAAAATTPAQVQSRQWWIGELGLRDAWKISRGAGITVAVIDEGVDTSVEDLQGATVPGFTGGGATVSPNKAWDSEGHGTVMAAYIAGRGRGPGIIGVAPAAKIMPVYLPSEDPQELADALDRLSAMSRPPQIVNMSFGLVDRGICADALQTAVKKAVDKGMILVASAGNSGSTSNGDQYPANCKGVVAVGAFDINVKPWVDTQRQPYVSLGGPGVKLVAYNKDLDLGTGTGTSGAAAIVSGTMALVRSHFPKLTPRQVVARVFATASKSTYHGPRYGQTGDTLGYGPALPHQALIRSVPANAPNPVYDDLAKLGGSSGSSASSPTVEAPTSSTPTAPPSGTSTANFPGSSPSAAASGSSSSGSNIGVIVGGLAAAVLVIALVAFLLVRRSRGAGAGPR